ncbi:MAG: hypothetical protein ACNA7W_17650 [Pseudomonadales bacterium]
MQPFHLPRLVGQFPLLAGVLALPLLAACGGAPLITSCEAAHGITPDCRFQNPEDLVVSPQGQFILVSQMGDMEGHVPGDLVALAPATGEIRPLFPGADRVQPAEGWGDAACPPPEIFSPHGIDLEQLESGAHALYVINHGGRESVEMFEVLEDEQGVELLWRGCVLAPEHGYFNDLVVLQNGDFWVSQMFPRDANVTWAALRMQFTGYAPGYAYHWSPAGGFARLPGTDAKFANGIEKSADERYVFLNSYFGDELIKVDTATGTRLGSVAVASPDNLTWSPTGELLVASHHASIPEMLACTEIDAGSCGFRFQIVAVNPDTLDARVLLDHEGPPMGAATVALPFEDSVYLGTFAGDRIARVSAEILAP